MRTRGWVWLKALCVALFLAVPAQAYLTSATFALDYKFGSDLGCGPEPYATVTITLIGADTAQFAVAFNTVYGNAFKLDKFCFNIQGAPVYISYNFIDLTDTGVLATYKYPDPDSKTMADGDGYFDYAVKYSILGFGYQASTFEVTLAGFDSSNPLKIETFMDPSTVDGGQGIYIFAAHFLASPLHEYSLWVGHKPSTVVPLPGSALLLGSGLLGLVFVGRRLRQRR